MPYNVSRGTPAAARQAGHWLERAVRVGQAVKEQRCAR